MSLVAGSALVITPVNCLISTEPPPPAAHFFSQVFMYTYTHTYGREPWHHAKHAKPAIKFHEHVDSCKCTPDVVLVHDMLSFHLFHVTQAPRVWNRELNHPYPVFNSCCCFCCPFLEFVCHLKKYYLKYTLFRFPLFSNWSSFSSPGLLCILQKKTWKE